MPPHGQRMRDGSRGEGPVGLWFRLAYYAALLLIGATLVGALCLMSFLN